MKIVILDDDGKKQAQFKCDKYLLVAEKDGNRTPSSNMHSERALGALEFAKLVLYVAPTMGSIGRQQAQQQPEGLVTPEVSMRAINEQIRRKQNGQ